VTYSFFNADLRCTTCGSTSAASFTTKIEAEPGDVLRVGSATDVTVTDMTYSHYTLRLPRDGEPLRVLEVWDCAVCGAPQWVEVSIDGGRVVSIDPFTFDRSTFDRVQFVSDGLPEFYERVTGESIFVDDALRTGWQERLRQRLP
jgi:hypothetical protein